jgi:monoamine oxidase
MTLADYLKSQGASADAVTLLGQALWFGQGWESGSALHRLVSDVALFYMGQATLVLQGGSDLLPQAFARGLRDRIRYGVPVVQVRQEAGKVQVDCLQAGQAERLEAERVICTVPVPALRRIGFSPSLSAAKKLAVDGLEYSPVTRIYLQSRRRFWAEAGCAGNAGTDLPIHMVAEHPSARAADLGARSILECHLKGEQAQRVAGMDDAKLLALALDSMEKVHPGFRAHSEGGTVARWADGPWSGGAYPFWKPGQLTAWLPELRRPEGPEGRVHFAGEHTSILSRTMEGALESGSRAAREVHAAVG